MDATVGRLLAGIWAPVAQVSDAVRVQCADTSPLNMVMGVISEFKLMWGRVVWCCVNIAVTSACSCCVGVMDTMSGNGNDTSIAVSQA